MARLSVEQKGLLVKIATEYGATSLGVEKNIGGIFVVIRFLRVGQRNKCFWRLHRLGYILIETGTESPRNKSGGRRFLMKFRPKYERIIA